jgi:hypothetical protein
VTHRVIKDEPGGVRHYKCGHRYTLMADEDRTNGRRKPDDPRAVRFHGIWFLPLDLLPEDQRVMPETRPDEETLEHRAICRCDVCRRPQAAVLWRRRGNPPVSHPDLPALVDDVVR